MWLKAGRSLQIKWCDREADHGEAQARQESSVIKIGGWMTDRNLALQGYHRLISARLLAVKSPQFKKINDRHLALQDHHKLISATLLAGKSSQFQKMSDRHLTLQERHRLITMGLLVGRSP
ncbi:uncharacterized protein G2W53_003807 [Senna tora]|uniref:Uncharacterized protein n=1 Tax=Senna tora TaxID=362788 RepID=A0A834XAS4_9FABA|nr:uncharacterized protein G2W53_003807 [Senna tora]